MDLLHLAEENQPVRVIVTHYDPTGLHPLLDDAGQPETSVVELREPGLAQIEAFRKWARGTYSRKGKRTGGPDDQAIGVRALRETALTPNLSGLDDEALLRLIRRTGGDQGPLMQATLALMGFQADIEEADPIRRSDIGKITPDDLPTS